MAKRVIQITEFIDDLDGGSAAGTVSFAFDGVSYEIDLSKKNRTGMEKALKPYLDHARKVRGTRPRKPVTKRASAGGKRDLAAVRAWAAEQGIAVSDRGRIAADVMTAYEAAQ